jgi:hypothetical protein
MGVIVALLRIPLIFLSARNKIICNNAKKMPDGQFLFCMRPKYHFGKHCANSGKSWQGDYYEKK